MFSALANAQSLRHLNLYRNSGLTGPLVPPLAPLTGGLCQLARRSLNTLTADGISLTGGIPACLVNNGSRLVELHLGECRDMRLLDSSYALSSAAAEETV